ncbi:MAG: triose-phosphate isomerase [Puniceicoccales bacterium]|jgi:triosephosphate isomerase|nr:triose-phosphate isomerase [Puniceicoccales bacterium]
MEKKYLIIGNWKMYKAPSQAVDLASEILKAGCPENAALVVCPPFTHLWGVAAVLKNSAIALGAQNMYPAAEGAFTGEISPAMLRDLGASYVIIGHSERRSIFRESNELIHQKVKAAQDFQLTPILCVGETLVERESGQHREVVEEQISSALEGISDTHLIIAYEPVWAIGTGRTATPELAQEMHAFIRDLLKKRFREEGLGVHILYGGSVKPGNAAELFAQPDITGGLIGGASIVAEDFMAIARAAEVA